MLFNSWPFVTLVVVTGFLYYTLGRTENRQILILIAASLTFYGYGQPYLLILLIISIVANSAASYWIMHAGSALQARLGAITGVLINLGVLSLFKYGGLFADTMGLSTVSEHGIAAWLLQLPLPIGISFYTFQGISLVVDTFSGEFQYQKLQQQQKSAGRHFRDVFFFISFFPQLVAGPVLKAKQFVPQIRYVTRDQIQWSYVAHCLVTGYFLKMVIADNLKDQTFWMEFPYFQWRSSLDLLVMLLGYSGQIFSDFAGYSLIAIGVAGLFGYRLPRNFNFPYVSRSIAEFWRRWHISLSSWLREYLYIPLGGNRHGHLRTYLNLIIVMFLGGLWHGAAWSFAIWGLWHGIGLAIERLCRNDSPPGPAMHSVSTGAPIRRAVVSVMQWAGVFAFVSFGWLLFKLTDISEAFSYLNAIAFNLAKPNSPLVILTTGILLMPVVVYHLLHLADQRFGSGNSYLHGFLYGLMLFLIAFNAGSSAAFVYFQF